MKKKWKDEKEKFKKLKDDYFPINLQVLGKHMNSILCDNSDTGRECISYLREQHYPPETFLPIADLRAEPIREHLRDLKNLPGVKLIFDVISVPNNDSNIRRALQFVCGNSMVCDTPEQAREIAYGIALSPGERYRAVALDGTQFQVPFLNTESYG